MVAEVKDEDEKFPHITDPGGVIAVCAMSADGEDYTWQGSGSVSRTNTTVKQEYYEGDEKKSRTIPVEYVTIIMTIDPTLPQARIPVHRPTSKQVNAKPDAWDH